MSRVVAVNPFRCKLWSLHDRLEDTITEQTCKAEIDSFLRFGQVVPALGRPLVGESGFDIEIICGARRLFVARHLKKELLVELRDMTDREAIIAMDIENNERREIGAYELGICYKNWLRNKVFSSQEELARVLRRSPSQVSRSLKVGQLPAVIVGAFATPLDICEAWGIELVDAWECSGQRVAMARAARELGARHPRPSAEEVFERLMRGASKGQATKRQAHDHVVKDDEGAPLFRIATRRRWVCVLIPSNVATAAVVDEVSENVKRVLTLASPPPDKDQLPARPTQSRRKTVGRQIEVGTPAQHAQIAAMSGTT